MGGRGHKHFVTWWNSITKSEKNNNFYCHFALSLIRRIRPQITAKLSTVREQENSIMKNKIFPYTSAIFLSQLITTSYTNVKNEISIVYREKENVKKSSLWSAPTFSHNLDIIYTSLWALRYLRFFFDWVGIRLSAANCSRQIRHFLCCSAEIGTGQTRRVSRCARFDTQQAEPTSTLSLFETIVREQPKVYIEKSIQRKKRSDR